MDYSDPEVHGRPAVHEAEGTARGHGLPRAAAEETLAAHGGDVEPPPMRSPRQRRPAARLWPRRRRRQKRTSKAPRPRNVLMAEFEGLSRRTPCALRDAGGDLDKARALVRSKTRRAAQAAARRRDDALPAAAADVAPPEDAPARKPARRKRKRAAPPPTPAARRRAADPSTRALRVGLRRDGAPRRRRRRPRGRRRGRRALFVGAARAALQRVALWTNQPRHVRRGSLRQGPLAPGSRSCASVQAAAGGDATAAMAALTPVGVLVPLTDEARW